MKTQQIKVEPQQSKVEPQQSKEPKSVDALRSEYQATVDQFLQISSAIEERIKTLAEKEAHQQKLEKCIEENILKAKHKIKLDVGGQSFTTSKTSLLRFEGSFFWTMLSGGKWEPDEDGFYFIDHNPKYFDRILDYHRTGEFDDHGLDEAALLQLKKDFDFFQLPPLPKWLAPVATLTWDPSYLGTNLQLSDGNKTVVKTSGGSGYNAGVLGTEAVSSYKVKVNSRGASGAIMVGFAPQSGFQPNGQNYGRCGYYLFLANGCLYSGHGHSNSPYTQAINNGDILTVKYDASSKNINFEKNGKDLGVAFSNVASGMFPALDIHDANASLSLL